MRLKESSSAKQVQGHGTRQFQGLAERGSGPARLLPVSQRMLFGLFVLQAAFVATRVWPLSLANRLGWWPEALLLLLATVATLAWLARELPVQNAAFALALLVLMEGALNGFNAETGLPFGREAYLSTDGLVLAGGLPWGLALLWAVMLLNARGVARWFLQPWRANPNYGLGVLGLTTLLALSLGFALEPFAVRVAHFWRWDSAGFFSTWFSIPGQAVLGRGLATLGIMALVTPVLMNKKPVDLPPVRAPLALWASLLLLFLTGAGVNRLWFVAGVCLAELLLIAWVLWRRSRSPACV